jgi:HEAT repeat protein
MLWLKQHQLKSSNVATRRRAAEQLVSTPDVRAFDGLRDALRDEDAEVRRLAATALGKMEDERRIEPLIEALHDNDPEVQKAVISALKHVKNVRVMTGLAQLIRHDDATVSGRAVRVLESFGWRPSNREDQIWYHVALGQFARAAASGPDAIPALEKVITSGPYNLQVPAVEAMGTISDPRVMRPMLTALRSEDNAVCMAAIEALSLMGTQQAGDAITGMLPHTSSHVRVAAAEALGKMHFEAAVEPLRALLSDRDWDVRRAAAETLGRLKDSTATQALAQGLTDSDADVREATALALGNLADRGAIGPLVKALNDPASGVRRMAAAALSRIDENWNESEEARAAIEEINAALAQKARDAKPKSGLSMATPAESALEFADGGSEELTAAGAEKNRKLAVGLFIATLCDTDRDLRQAAAECLGRLGDRRAETALVRALRDEDVSVRKAVENALQTMGVGDRGME